MVAPAAPAAPPAPVRPDRRGAVPASGVRPPGGSGPTPWSRAPRVPLAGLALALGLHALVFALAARHPVTVPPPAAVAAAVIWLQALPSSPPPAPPEAAPPEAAPPARWPVAVAALAADAPRAAATQAAPPAPTAEEWAFASRYTLKNAKAYRHTWGQQVRSMMGTAVEGADAGWVRFRVEIAPDGQLARLDTLWTTSATAEHLARQAIQALPRWPPTPTGQPLVFERTIGFTPHASDVPPLYRDDCLPDPPAFSNPFAWDGRSPPQPAPPRATAAPDAQALADCLRQLPPDSIEAEGAHDQRQLERWASPRLGS